MYTFSIGWVKAKNGHNGFKKIVELLTSIKSTAFTYQTVAMGYRITLHLLLLGIASSIAVAQNPSRLPLSPPAPINELAWDTTTKEIFLKPGEWVIDFSFAVTNRHTNTITIERADTSCGCTTVELPTTPWKLSPGQSGLLKVHLDASGKTGTLFKTILVQTSVGPKSLMIKAHLPEPGPGKEMNRMANQKVAQVDRQSVFQGKCAVCHADPTKGKTGLNLYQTACGICHSAEHRATMVPDLKALKIATSKDYWENWIRNGKPGSLMPAFEQKQGGPLTEEQISSLVEFLSSQREFAGNPTNSIGNAPK